MNNKLFFLLIIALFVFLSVKKLTFTNLIHDTLKSWGEKNPQYKEKSIKCFSDILPKHMCKNYNSENDKYKIGCGTDNVLAACTNIKFLNQYF
jgi:hypothetical protein